MAAQAPRQLAATHSSAHVHMKLVGCAKAAAAGVLETSALGKRRRDDGSCGMVERRGVSPLVEAVSRWLPRPKGSTQSATKHMLDFVRMAVPANRRWATAMPSSAHSLSSPQPSLHYGPRHLIVMANGLFGSARNWDVVSKLDTGGKGGYQMHKRPPRLCMLSWLQA
jgi:hypothetical protein